MILKFTIAACFLMPVFLFSQTEKDFYVSARELPEPVGGIMAIQQNVVYPESARWDSIQGTVYVEAFIDSQGNVMRTKIVRGIREDVDEAAAAAILLTKFKPGRIYGKAVNVKLVIPIRFRLTGTEVSPIKKNVDKPTVFILRGPEEMKKEIVYPEIAVRAGIEGTVFASAVVDENRSIKELAIIRGIGAGCDESVLRALASAKFVLAVAREKDKGAEKIPIIVDFVLPRK